jgi:hypothetical protein
MSADALMRSAAGRRLGGVFVALVNLAGAVVLAFLALIADGLRCDDACSNAPGWRNDPSAWQWHAGFVVSLVILGSALVLTLAMATRGARWLRSVAVGVQLAAVVSLALVDSTASGTQPGWGFAVVLCAFFAVTGVAAARSA